LLAVKELETLKKQTALPPVYLVKDAFLWPKNAMSLTDSSSHWIEWEALTSQAYRESSILLGDQADYVKRNFLPRETFVCHCFLREPGFVRPEPPYDRGRGTSPKDSRPSGRHSAELWFLSQRHF